MKLYQPDSRERELYAMALDSLGYETSSLPSGTLSVDKAGYSPQAAPFLGEDYIKGKSIVVSSKQREAGMVKNDIILESLLSGFYGNESGGIDRFVSNPNSYGQPLIGEVRMNQKKDGFHFRLRFDTTDGALKSYRSFVRRFRTLDKDLTILFNRKYINNMLKLKLWLEERIGAIDSIPTAFLETKEVLESGLKTIGYIEEKGDVTFFHLDNGRPVLVYFGDVDEKELDGDYEVKNGEDVSATINALFWKNYIYVDSNSTTRAMDRTLDESLSGLGYSPENMSLIEKLNLTKEGEVMMGLGRWLSLGEIKKGLSDSAIISRRFTGLDPDLRLMIIEPSEGDLVVSHLMERIRNNVRD